MRAVHRHEPLDGCYNCSVDTKVAKALIDTNTYLRVPEEYRRALITNVSSSCAIETAASAKAIADALVKSEDRIWLIEVKKAGGSSR